MCAVEHNVKQSDQAEGSYGKGPKSQQVQIAVMLRTDVFRKAWACEIHSIPEHSQVFRVVNTEAAKNLAETSVFLCDLDAVFTESR